MKPEMEAYLLAPDSTVIQAMTALEKASGAGLFIVDAERKLVGSLTDGDVRRWILQGGDLRSRVEDACNRSPRTVGKGYRKTEVRDLMTEGGIDVVPVLDCLGRVKDLLFWKDLSRVERQPRHRLPEDVRIVVMAGGKGTRLDPFTRILPKPLIPVGGKAILEVILDRFQDAGARHFLVSVHHKAKIIKAYLDEMAPHLAIEYLDEPRPLGTAGALAQLKGRFDKPLIITNCDILIDADYAKILEHHVAHGNRITIVASLKRYTIPYGICKVEDGGVLASLEEKPEFGYLANTGMYVIDQSVLEHLELDGFLHMTDLVEKVRTSAGRVGVFPVGENSWFDTGEWVEYRKTVEHFALKED